MNPRPIISVVVGACFAVTTGYLTILGCSGSTPGATVPRAVCLESSGGWSVVASFVFPTFASLFLLNRTRRSGASKELPLGAKQLMVIGALSAVMAAAAFGGVQALATPSIQSDPNLVGIRELLIDSLSLFILPLFLALGVAGMATFRHFVRRVPDGWEVAAWKVATCLFAGALGFYLSLGSGGGIDCTSYGAPLVVYSQCASIFNAENVQVYHYAYAVNFAFWTAAGYLFLVLVLGMAGKVNWKGTPEGFSSSSAKSSPPFTTVQHHEDTPTCLVHQASCSQSLMGAGR